MEQGSHKVGDCQQSTRLNSSRYSCCTLAEFLGSVTQHFDTNHQVACVPLGIAVIGSG